jgi:hypothetical protein
MAVLYSRISNDTEGDAEPEVQFTCMKTFERDSDVRRDPLGSGAAVGAGVASSALVLLIGLLSVLYSAFFVARQTQRCPFMIQGLSDGPDQYGLTRSHVLKSKLGFIKKPASGVL